MKYKKPFLSIQQQIQRLKDRGLVINDVESAKKILSTKSYYRLRAYTYPFQDNENADQPFVKSISLEEIIALYKFDGKLRKNLFWALEKIEIALRTQIIYQYAKTYGSHWQMRPEIFRDTGKFVNHLESLNKEIERSRETFIQHYNKKYGDPSQPPAWMSLEVASFGLLSKIFQNLKKGPEKSAVTNFFGLKSIGDLENWMFCFSMLRNICAHHSRAWNRRFTAQPRLPYNLPSPFLSKQQAESLFPNKLYAVVCCMAYMLKHIDLSDFEYFKNSIISLVDSCPLGQGHEMGFVDDWQEHPVWEDIKH